MNVAKEEPENKIVICTISGDERVYTAQLTKSILVDTQTMRCLLIQFLDMFVMID